MIASYSPPKLEYAKLDSPSSKASPDLPSRSGLFFTCGALFYVRCSVSRLYMQLLYVVSMAQTAIYLDSKGPAGILRGLRGFGLSKIGA
jgi:hypothetical protein